MECLQPAGDIFRNRITLLARTDAPLPRSHIAVLTDIVDRMGIASAKAQCLRNPITSYDRVMSSGSNQHLYLLRSDTASSIPTSPASSVSSVSSTLSSFNVDHPYRNPDHRPSSSSSFSCPEERRSGRRRRAKPPVTIVGMLKVGEKRLFISDAAGRHHDIRPLCVLDFYVHEDLQRSGFGKALFEFMLKTERVEPRQLSYDRPSPKFFDFLKRHYALKDYIPQTTNMVLFKNYGLDEIDKENKGHQSSHGGRYTSSETTARAEKSSLIAALPLPKNNYPFPDILRRQPEGHFHASRNSEPSSVRYAFEGSPIDRDRISRDRHPDYPPSLPSILSSQADDRFHDGMDGLNPGSVRRFEESAFREKRGDGGRCGRRRSPVFAEDFSMRDVREGPITASARCSALPIESPTKTFVAHLTPIERRVRDPYHVDTKVDRFAPGTASARSLHLHSSATPFPTPPPKHFRSQLSFFERKREEGTKLDVTSQALIPTLLPSTTAPHYVPPLVPTRRGRRAGWFDSYVASEALR